METVTITPINQFQASHINDTVSGRFLGGWRSLLHAMHHPPYQYLLCPAPSCDILHLRHNHSRKELLMYYQIDNTDRITYLRSHLHYFITNQIWFFLFGKFSTGLLMAVAGNTGCQIFGRGVISAHQESNPHPLGTLVGRYCTSTSGTRILRRRLSTAATGSMAREK